MPLVSGAAWKINSEDASRVVRGGSSVESSNVHRAIRLAVFTPGSTPGRAPSLPCTTIGKSMARPWRPENTR